VELKACLFINTGGDRPIEKSGREGIEGINPALPRHTRNGKVARGLPTNYPDTLEEKGECSKMRRIPYTISLLTHASKVLLRVLTKRLQAKAEADGCLGEYQLGFRKGSGTRALRIMAERSLENNQVIVK